MAVVSIFFVNVFFCF